MNQKQKTMLKRIVAAAIVYIAAAAAKKMNVFAGMPQPWTELVVFLIPYLIIGWDIVYKAFRGIKNGQVFDENFLMAIATIGAIALGEYVEGAAVMLFYQIGELFQSYAVGKSRKNITALMDIRPDYPDDVEIGTIIVVKPGEKIPIDGIVVSGESTLNTSALTGESLPRSVKVKDEIISGCVNLTGLLKIETTKEFGESTVSKILDLVENSSMKKSRSENFITRFSKVYTPAVCIGALVLAVIPPVVSLIMGNPAEWSKWLIRALTTLVISCPCALVISIPLSFFGGIGGASSRGILIKGSNYLENLSKAKYVVCDKTGTLTKGVFEVTDVITANGFTKEDIIKSAAYAESYSSHPISKSIREAYGMEVETGQVTDIEEISGHGVKADIGGKEVLAGNLKLMNKYNIDSSAGKDSIENALGTLVYVAIGGIYAGCIVISDVIKPTSQQAIAALKKAGVKKVIMLTGDAKKVAEQVAGKLGVDEVKSELLPADKVIEVEKLLNSKGKDEMLAFVGDGINDAPVLSRADIGIAMGALGSDAAIEAADIVLMDDDPAKIATAMNISRKTLRIVHQNIVFALAIKIACLALGAAGVANMWMAIFADVGVMVLAVLNATRCLSYKD